MVNVESGGRKGLEIRVASGWSVFEHVNRRFIPLKNYLRFRIRSRCFHKHARKSFRGMPLGTTSIYVNHNHLSVV